MVLVTAAAVDEMGRERRVVTLMGLLLSFAGGQPAPLACPRRSRSPMRHRSPSCHVIETERAIELRARTREGGCGSSHRGTGEEQDGRLR